MIDLKEKYMFTTDEKNYLTIGLNANKEVVGAAYCGPTPTEDSIRKSLEGQHDYFDIWGDLEVMGTIDGKMVAVEAIRIFKERRIL